MIDLNKALQKALMPDRAEPQREGETDLEFCARKFEGKVFPCSGCGKEIQWIGACEECKEKFNSASMDDFDRIRACGVPHNFAHCTWKNFKAPGSAKHKALIKEIDQLKTWRGIPPLAVISGRPGTGKTHMAVATMWRRMTSSGPYKMHFIQERAFLERLKRGFSDGQDDYAERIFRIRFLILDDFGQSRMTEWVLDTVVGLICRRFDEGKVTLLTTNLVHKDMAELDPRLGSRVYEALAVGTSSLPDYRKGKE
jgi:DNA replication protein DnaC